jgi:glycosyltransferase involved in cell wall biosynthesis
MEVIVVEDGSRHGIQKWLEEMESQSVRYFCHEKNRRLAAARNTGIRNARGHYIAFLDDDDEWLPEKLARQIDLFKRENDTCGVVYCGGLLLSKEGRVVGQNWPKLRGDIRSAIRKRGLFTVPSSCVFRRAALDRVGGYDETLSSHIDHDIWLQLAREGYACTFVGECLVKVHQHLGYRMSEKPHARIWATRQFCEKWEADLLRWFGPTDGKRYCSRFKGSVMAMLGWAFFDKGKRRQGLKYFSMALRYDWKKRDYYEGLVASVIGTGLWERFLKTWKRFKRCTT